MYVAVLAKHSTQEKLLVVAVCGGCQPKYGFLRNASDVYGGDASFTFVGAGTSSSFDDNFYWHNKDYEIRQSKMIMNVTLLVFVYHKMLCKISHLILDVIHQNK